MYVGDRVQQLSALKDFEVFENNVRSGHVYLVLSLPLCLFRNSCYIVVLYCKYSYDEVLLEKQRVTTLVAPNP